MPASCPFCVYVHRQNSVLSIHGGSIYHGVLWFAWQVLRRLQPLLILGSSAARCQVVCFSGFRYPFFIGSLDIR